MVAGPPFIFELNQADPFSATSAWADLTARLGVGSTRRGRNRNVDRFQAGQMASQLQNRDRVLEPENTQSYLYPHWVPMHRVRFSVNLNLLTANQSSIETDASGWANNGNATVTRTTAQHLSGAAALQLQAIANGAVSAITNPGGTSSIPVTPGNWYTAMAWLKAGINSRTASVTLLWHDASGTQIGGTSSPLVTTTTSGWVQATFAAQAPAGAAFVRVQVSITGAIATETFYVDQIGLFPTANWAAWCAGDPYRIFTGFIDELVDDWPGRVEGRMTLTAIDHFGSSLAAKKVNNGGGYVAIIKAMGVVNAYDFLQFDDPPLSVTLKSRSWNPRPDWGVNGDATGASPILGGQGPLLAERSSSVNLVGKTGWFGAGTGAALAGTSAMSIEAWVLLLPGYGAGGTPDYQIFHQFDTVSNWISFVIANGANRIDLSYEGGGTNFSMDTTGVSMSLADGIWHHVVWTRASDGKTNRLYLDGTLVATKVDTTARNIGAGATAVGGYIPSAGAAANPAFNGALALFATYQFQLAAADITAHANFGPPGWPSQTPGARTTKVLDALGIPAGDRNIEAGTATLQGATGTLTDTLALDYLNTVWDSEQGGRIFTAADGRITTQGSAHSVGASLATFGDAGGSEIPYTMGAPKIVYGRREIFNEFTYQRVGGSAQSAVDATSQTAYGIQSGPSRDNLLNTDDAAVLALAQYDLAAHKDPKLRFDQLVLNPQGDPTGRVWIQAASREIGDLVTIVKRPHWEIGGFNLLTANQASIETDASGWTNNGNATVSRDTSQHFSGAASLQLQAIANGAVSAITSPGGTSSLPVVAGNLYTAMAWFHSGLNARTAQVSILWHDATGTQTSGVSSPIVTAPTGTWAQAVFSAVAPPGTAYARVQVSIVSAIATETFYVDQISFAREGSANWTPGGQEIRRDVRIEGIAWNFDGKTKRCRCTWQLSPA